MNKIEGCDHDDDKLIDWDEFCIKNCEQEELYSTQLEFNNVYLD